MPACGISLKSRLVNIFSPFRDVSPVVDEAIVLEQRSLDAGRIIMRSAEKARAAGLKVVMDSCIRSKHPDYQGMLFSPGIFLRTRGGSEPLNEREVGNEVHPPLSSPSRRKA